MTVSFQRTNSSYNSLKASAKNQSKPSFKSGIRLTHLTDTDAFKIRFSDKIEGIESSIVRGGCNEVLGKAKPLTKASETFITAVLGGVKKTKEEMIKNIQKFIDDSNLGALSKKIAQEKAVKAKVDFKKTPTSDVCLYF